MTTATSYSEVFEILKLMGKDNVEKIPLNILEKIDNLRDKNYEVKIDPEMPLEQQKISRKALSILAWLNLEYLCNEQEKEVLTDIYKLNDRKDKQTVNNLQFNLKKDTVEDKKTEEIRLIEKKVSLWDKIVNKLKHIFKK